MTDDSHDAERGLNFGREPFHRCLVCVMQETSRRRYMVNGSQQEKQTLPSGCRGEDMSCHLSPLIAAHHFLEIETSHSIYKICLNCAGTRAVLVSAQLGTILHTFCNLGDETNLDEDLSVVINPPSDLSLQLSQHSVFIWEFMQRAWVNKCYQEIFLYRKN